MAPEEFLTPPQKTSVLECVNQFSHMGTQTSELDDGDTSSNTDSETNSTENLQEGCEESFTEQRLEEVYNMAFAVTGRCTVDKWFATGKAQLDKKRNQFARNPAQLKQLLLAKRELASVVHDRQTQHVTGVEFLYELCCPHNLERSYFAKLGFD